MRQLVEQALGDGVVVAFAVPHAVLVAAAEMNAEGDRIETLHQLGIGAQRAREIAHWVFAALSHRLERRRIDVSGVAGGIDLHVATAGVGDFADHAPLDGDHVLEESVDIRVDRFGLLVREALADAIGADQRHLERLLRMPAREAILVQQEVALEAQALEHRPAARHRGAVVVQVRQVEALERLAARNALLGGAHIAGARRKAAHRGAPGSPGSGAPRAPPRPRCAGTPRRSACLHRTPRAPCARRPGAAGCRPHRCELRRADSRASQRPQ